MAPPKVTHIGKPPSPDFASFRITLTRPAPLIPMYASEADVAGNDIFTNGLPGPGANAQTGTFDVEIEELDSNAATTGRTKSCLLYVPTTLPSSNRVHICWAPGDPANEALNGAFRFAAERAGWILIIARGIEGGDKGGFTALSAAEVVGILRQASRPAQIDALRLSCHSRGYRGFRETLNGDLLVQRTGPIKGPKVPPSAVERVVILDAFYLDVFNAMNNSRIPGSKIFGYRVTVPRSLSGLPEQGKWCAPSSQTIDLLPVLNGVRAVLYSRLIQDAIKINKRPLVPPPGVTLPSITGRLLTSLPPLGNFSSRSSPTDFRAFCTSQAQAPAINNCLRDENTNLQLLQNGGPLWAFVNQNNLGGFNDAKHPVFTANIWAHQLFACEFVHEITDIADPQP